ncbi:MAG: EamA family transporter, partial [Abditibacteriota bacterium]|nr:EamA family transporter [Abditibacteriota bacterium]
LGYFFSVIVSLIIFAVLRRTEKPEGFTFKGFFTPSMYGFILLAGASNFIMNYIVVLLATRMDGSIVYPVVMGGGPVVATIAARVVFGEELNPKKITGILLGVLAIVLLNL